MKRTLMAAALLGVGLLSACSMTGPGNLRVHEVLLYGGAQERVVWVYGTLQGSQSSVKLGGTTADVRAQVNDALAVPGSLSVNGKATYRQATAALPPRLTLTRSGASLFTVSPQPGANIQAVYYTDGQSWVKLSGTSGAVSATRVDGLRGAGQLTDDEARALGDVLRPQGPLAVAVLSDTGLPDAPLAVEPTPTEYRRTALYIQSSVPTAAAPATPAVPSTGASVTFTELASGTNASAAAFGVQVATTNAAAAALYAQAYGRQTGAPTPPSVTGRTLIGVFLGQRSTGGYSVRVVGATVTGDAVTLRVRVTAPGAGSLTTQAITSPWTIVSVPGAYRTVTVVDEAGQPLSGGGTTR
ncbi:protease complex subunit PrcB family protein [Deinococcus taeanensis]|uniref:protease complex subunit PrcB family protein n=1 Tax=Deinococcus taeanensis TaxID=2737050 RepID=UPI001CDB4836|nr:protease complex subunit PrcB family protein [Deinococcus taeanensis]UBV43662.1 protease complex subunit PrcB family protein [Deinococcus taeanensis]